MPEPFIEQNYIVPITGGKTTAVTTLGTASVQVIAQDLKRRKITFCNPNIASNIVVYVCQSKDASGSNLAAVAGGGSWPIFPGAVFSFEGDVAASAWNAIAASGSNNGLTIMSSDTVSNS